MENTGNTQGYFNEYCGIMDTLLGENGCPWDRAQTHGSLRADLIEESYEVAEAIDSGDMHALCEELGDVLMLVVFHAALARKERAFTIDDVIRGISRKMVSRHSYIFGEDTADTAADVEAFWEKNKNKEKQYTHPADALEAVPRALPALMRAAQVIKRAKPLPSADEIFNHAHTLLGKLQRSLKTAGNAAGNAPPEPAEAPANGLSDTPEQLIGGLLFLLTQISVIFEINAEFSLTNKVEAFINSTRKQPITL